MEAGLSAAAPRGLWLALALVLLIRLPFLNQAVQGDDDIYITEAAHAQIEPLHPANVKYVFRGDTVDLRGHSHPPLNAWPLAVLLALFGEVKEVPFHAAYIAFSLMAVWAMWELAKRFSPRPLWATLLFCAVPAFVVNGNSFEPDIPFLAFWMASIALFVAERPRWPAIAASFAALEAYQAVFLPLIVVGSALLGCRRALARRFGLQTYLLAPVAVLVAVQLFERLSTGAVPAAVFIRLFHPLRLPGSGAQTAKRAGSGDSPLLHRLPDLASRRGHGRVAGTARAGHALPARVDRHLLCGRGRGVLRRLGSLPAAHCGAGCAAGVARAGALVGARVRAADGAQPRLGYRELQPLGRLPRSCPHHCETFGGHRVWVDGEWGLRYYLEQAGALPLTKTQKLRPGDMVVSSALGHSVPLTDPATVILQVEIRGALPLRILGLTGHSGFSDASAGLWPFGISNGPVDRVTAYAIGERHITLEYVPMSAAEAKEQIVGGIYADHWMGGTAVLALKSPAEARKVALAFYLPQATPPRRIALKMDGREIASATYAAVGAYTLESPPVRPAGATATLEIGVTPTFRAPGDARDLGVVVTAVGFVP